jgi:hypothetical protein
MSSARILGFLVAAVACFGIAYAVSHGSGGSDAVAAPVVAPMPVPAAAVAVPAAAHALPALAPAPHAARRSDVAEPKIRHNPAPSPAPSRTPAPSPAPSGGGGGGGSGGGGGGIIEG